MVRCLEQAEQSALCTADAPASPSKSAAAEAATCKPGAAGAGRSKREEELEFWVRQLEQSDDEVVRQMQCDLEGFLKELQPGYLQPTTTKAAAVAATAVKHHDPNAAVAAAKEAGAPQASAAAKKSKFDVWEKYYAFELAATQRR